MRPSRQFNGLGSAAAEAVGYKSVGIEIDPQYVKIAASAVPRLTALTLASR